MILVCGKHSPPKLGEGSTSVTRMPASACCNAAATPAGSPPKTITLFFDTSQPSKNGNQLRSWYFKFRNPKHEMRNNFQIFKIQMIQTFLGFLSALFRTLENLDFGFVSNFDIRYPDFLRLALGQKNSIKCSLGLSSVGFWFYCLVARGITFHPVQVHQPSPLQGKDISEHMRRRQFQAGGKVFDCTSFLP